MGGSDDVLYKLGSGEGFWLDDAGIKVKKQADGGRERRVRGAGEVGVQAGIV